MESKAWLSRWHSDPLVGQLLQNSSLTNAQFDTYLLDAFLRVNQAEGLRMDAVLKMRPKKRRVTRGAFNRTLYQAQRNVLRSIYTLLLLGYVGAFESPKLTPFLELADRLRAFVEEGATDARAKQTALAAMRKLLAESIESLARVAKSKRANGL